MKSIKSLVFGVSLLALSAPAFGFLVTHEEVIGTSGISRLALTFASAICPSGSSHNPWGALALCPSGSSHNPWGAVALCPSGSSHNPWGAVTSAESAG